jgi:signal transduction histidine kinase
LNIGENSSGWIQRKKNKPVRVKNLNQSEKKYARQQRILYWIMAAGIIVLLAVNLMAWIYLQRMKSFLISDLQFRLENIARMSAAIIDPEEMLHIFPEDPNDPLFIKNQLLLLDIKQANNLQDIYILNPVLELIVDTETGLSAVPVRKALEPGLAEQALHSNGGSGSIQVLGTNRFLNAVSPLLDQNNQVTAILVIEAQAYFFAELDKFEAGLSAFSLISVVIILGVAFMFFRALRKTVALQVQIQNQQNLVKLGEMAASVAHELRNPLSIIQGANALIQKKYGTTKDEFFTYIPTELARLNNLLENFLAFARTKPVETQAVNISELFDKISVGVQDESAQIELEIQHDLPLIYTDGHILEQILLNLIQNALQSSDQNQKVKIECRIEQNRLKFDIKDKGTGIPQADIEHVFEPFYTTREKGSGLGLAITKRLLDQLGGEIHISSKHGTGTEVTFWIPFQEKHK